MTTIELKKDNLKRFKTTNDILMSKSKHLTLRDKIVACYPHIITRSIYKVVGCASSYVYQTLRENDLSAIGCRYSKNNNLERKY